MNRPRKFAPVAVAAMIAAGRGMRREPDAAGAALQGFEKAI